MVNRTLVFLVLFFGWMTSEAQQVFTGKKGYAEFESKAPMLTFKGTSESLQGYVNLESGLVDFFLELNSLQTGINLRDKHMRNNYLETSKYPLAEFTGNLVQIPSDLSSRQAVSVKGKFKLHGVEREITVNGFLQKRGNDLLLEGSWQILLSDYKIEIPKVVFYELSEEQKITIKTTLNPQKQ